ncbi:MAG: DUF885 domain-containing protein [Acidobacteriota bacterium]
MKITLLALFALMAATFMAGCSQPPAPKSQDADFEALAGDYIEKLLELNPELATTLGDHRYDTRLGDYSQAGFESLLGLYRQTLDKLTQIDPAQLSSVNSVDSRILRTNLESGIFQLETLREHEWNPLTYNVGNAVYGLLTREFAPLAERLTHVKERLRALPGVLEAARKNLKNPPRIHTETAILQNKGNITLVRDELQAYLDKVPQLKSELVPVQQQAVKALEEFGTWLENDLLPRSHGDFRIGEPKFRRKLRYTLDSDLSLEDVLNRAQAELAATQKAIHATALPLFRQYFPGKDAGAPKAVVKAVLDKLAEQRPDNRTIVDQARRDLEETTQFVRESRLVTVPDEPIKIIVMPEFQRGVAVAYCDSAGPLEKNGETFYAIAPTPVDWTPGRVQSFFREYNNYMLKELTIHEAMPGHYLQLMHSNKFKAPTMVRAIFSSGPFVEGWACYAEQIMAEKGYSGAEVKMQQLKMRLRLIINAILDQKIHIAGMSEQEAMDLMMNEGYQEEGEAAGKWRRACLTSTQLSTYFVGTVELNEIRKAYEAKHGSIQDVQAFHDRMLSFGSPPARYVKELMGL